MNSRTYLVVLVGALVHATVSAFTQGNVFLTQRSTNRKRRAPSNQNTALDLYRSAAEAIAEAERICAEEGPYSERCKVAWDIVEELEAADAHVRKPAAEPGFLSYSPLVEGLDILSKKIERKMDELKKLSTTLAEEGAGPEVERLVYASDEMKQILAEARAAMDQYR